MDPQTSVNLLLAETAITIYALVRWQWKGELDGWQWAVAVLYFVVAAVMTISPTPLGFVAAGIGAVWILIETVGDVRDWNDNRIYNRR